jgi:hypothetical protein
MELYRQAPYAALPVGTQTPTTPVGSDGHTYWMQVEGHPTCVIAGSTPPTCLGGTPASRPVQLVTITVRDGSATARILFSENATFDSSTG